MDLFKNIPLNKGNLVLFLPQQVHFYSSLENSIWKQLKSLSGPFSGTLPWGPWSKADHQINKASKQAVATGMPISIF